MNPHAEEFYENATQWREEYYALREIALDCQLTEEFKWMHPCYTSDGKNIIIIHGFMDYCGMSFVKGSLLNDPEEILHIPGKNTQSGRILKFTSVEEIKKRVATIKAYIFEAIEIEKQGLQIKYDKPEDMEFPEELLEAFSVDENFEKAFRSLTPGRQKGYLLHFNGAKQSQTKVDRINKYYDRILDGKGIRDCICGLSKRLPNCDGSHKSVGLKV